MKKSVAMDMTEAKEHLAAFFPFWESLDARQQDALAGSATKAHFDDGAHVHSGDADCVGVLLVISGSLRAYMLAESGRECMLFRVGANETCVLAATCVLQLITFDLFLDAEGETDLILVDPDIFARIVEEHVEVEAYTYRQTAERFSDVMWVMHQQLFMGLDARLAIYLLDEVARLGTTELAITHDEIARNIGSAREAVSRMLKTFVDQGSVSLARGQVIIQDKAALRALARG